MRRTSLLATALLVALPAAAETEPRHWRNAPTPPMGWNSWDCFGTTLTEAQAKAQADAMAQYLKPYGWNVFTVDIQWYEPESKGHAYKDGAKLEMDKYSRLVPAVKKFPSATNEAGFKPLADYVHSKGLKFGIHIMRGIPKQAVAQNTPIRGTRARAQDIAKQDSTCGWNPDMFGVDMAKEGAQDYYDSLFKLYASWGVDFVKVDDISRPYDNVQRAEVEAIRKAIDKSGRPIVLSLSPGDTPLDYGEHVMKHANLWRISDDFWDRWQPLHEMFGRLEKWTPHRAPGAWPDADMLPFGTIEFKRPTNFTQDEQVLCLSLWCIARSPLIFGGDMTKLDPFTLRLLTNPEVLAVNQKSTGNRQLSRDNDLIVWAAEVPGTRDRYVGLFNAQDRTMPYDLTKALYRSPILRKSDEVANISVSVAGAKQLVLVVTDAGDNIHLDHADWIEPTLRGPKGELKISGVKWRSGQQGYGETRANTMTNGQPISVAGKPVEGIGTHAFSVIEFDVPEGYDTFQGRGVLSPSRPGEGGSIEFVVLTDAANRNIPDRNTVSVTLAELGIPGKAKARDLWKRQDLGVVEGKFSQAIPLHGAGLYRLSPAGN